MQNLLFSPARLLKPEYIDVFSQTFRYHGVLGYHDPSAHNVFTELQKLSIVPLVFGLLPKDALRRKQWDLKVKPLIREHLHLIKLYPEELLIDILKSIADQYASTWQDESFIRKKRKFTIEDLRARGKPYRQLISNQKNRCDICGCKFDADVEQHLDHIIPWRLIGDIPDGANWRILCNKCNNGKKSMLSIFQSPMAWNWTYGDTADRFLRDFPNWETRYIVFARDKFCVKCNRGSSVVALKTTKLVESGMPIFDNLQTVCEGCL